MTENVLIINQEILLLKNKFPPPPPYVWIHPALGTTELRPALKGINQIIYAQ